MVRRCVLAAGLLLLLGGCGGEGGVVPAARPAVRILDGFIDGVGARKVTWENATHAP